MKKIFVALAAVAMLLSVAACGELNETEQKADIAELEARGFSEITYLGVGAGYADGDQQYAASLDDCRLTLSRHSNSWVWVVEQGNNYAHTAYVIGDDRLNADWLRDNPTGTATSGGYITSPSYDLTSCLSETENGA